MLKGEIMKGPRRNFPEILSKTLEIPNDSISDHYKFGKVIGLGQYGTVKEAWSLVDPDIHVAVKILDLKGIAKTFKSICCEVSSLKQADHPNIIKLLQVFKDEIKLYLVFEYVDGIDLSDYITEHIKISESKAIHILKQIVNTIDYLHSIHICHRDIKLDNIMVNLDNLETKLIDFGFATTINERGRLKGKIGTPYYVAPEVISGTYGQECDMWSIGIMTYYMLVGDPPFNAESDSELFDNIVHNEVPYHQKHWEQISPEAVDFIQKLLNKDQHKRMTAKEAISHPWLTQGKTSNSPELSTNTESP
jgi:calcium-dependent protein kinase